MAPTIIMTDRATQLENCAAWHIGEMERALGNGEKAKAERHDAIAFGLFQRVRALRLGQRDAA